ELAKRVEDHVHAEDVQLHANAGSRSVHCDLLGRRRWHSGHREWQHPDDLLRHSQPHVLPPMTSDSGDDAGREPLAPSDVALLLESGVPPEAITDSGLDLDLLRSLGW